MTPLPEMNERALFKFNEFEVIHETICIIGAYAINNSFFDVGVMMIFGVLGYLMRKFDYEPTSLVFLFILKEER